MLDPQNREHHRFVPVWNWIYLGKGRMIYGGTKYLAELRRMAKFLKIIVELRRKGRLIVLPQEEVDRIANKTKAKVSDAAFDDEHLVAIVVVSSCRVVCTDDLRAMQYLKRRELYSEYHMKPPSIYHQETHAHLCCDENLLEICKKSTAQQAKRKRT